MRWYKCRWCRYEYPELEGEESILVRLFGKSARCPYCGTKNVPQAHEYPEDVKDF